MTVPTRIYPYDGDVANGVNPYKPGLTDFTGNQKEDYGQAPPDPVTMPNAHDWNQFVDVLTGHSRLLPVAMGLVTITAGTPAITALLAPSNAVLISDFTITDNGVGDTTIRCPATKLPAPLMGDARCNSTTQLTESVSTLGTFDGLRIITRTPTGTATDVNFLFFWYA